MPTSSFDDEVLVINIYDNRNKKITVNSPELGDELELLLLPGIGGPGPRSRDISQIGSIVVETLLQYQIYNIKQILKS